MNGLFRALLGSALVVGFVFVAGCQVVTTPQPGASIASNTVTDDVADQEWYIGVLPDTPYDIPLVDRSKMKPEFMRQTVSFASNESVGAIVVDIDNRFLYLIEGSGMAIRYAIGVGRQGFSWHGSATVGRKGIWPDWTPTSTMRKIIPGLPARMAGGVDSPLGARALYLYQNGQDILFRIHGTNEPWSIGERVSSGCVRMLNEDIYDLYQRVKVGASVFVRNAKHHSAS